MATNSRTLGAIRFYPVVSALSASCSMPFCFFFSFCCALALLFTLALLFDSTFNDVLIKTEHQRLRRCSFYQYRKLTNAASFCAASFRIWPAIRCRVWGLTVKRSCFTHVRISDARYAIIAARLRLCLRSQHNLVVRSRLVCQVYGCISSQSRRNQCVGTDHAKIVPSVHTRRPATLSVRRTTPAS